LDGPNVFGDLPNEAAADSFLLPFAQLARVAYHAALSAAQRNVNDGGLPSHPGRKCADGVNRFIGMEADAALGGASRVAVLHAEPLEHLYFSIVHADRDAEMVFAHWDAQKFPSAAVQPKFFCNAVKLVLGHFKRVKGRISHKVSPQ